MLPCKRCCPGGWAGGWVGVDFETDRGDHNEEGYSFRDAELALFSRVGMKKHSKTAL